MRLLDALLVSALGLAECDRPPPEEFRRPPTGGSTGGASTEVAASPPLVQAADKNAGRCVAPIPAAAPPEVPRGPAPGCPADPEPPGPPPEIATLRFTEASGAAVIAEVVRSDHDTMRGLMYRRAMGEDNGMLFDLRVREDHKFWMHNTCIPLDLMFIDEDGLIVGIVENAPTLNDDSRGVGCPSRWVLEVNAGWSRRHGVRPGQSLVFP